MDKTEEINNRLHYLKKVITDEMPYSVQGRTLMEIDTIMSLVCGCSDNSQIVVAYDRCQLDEAIGKKSTDWQWQMAWEAIHANDGAWSAMSDNCSEAEDDILHMVEEEEMNND
tara:strand:+ start:277 stop:615 length:339 start_codon:yes stop_codon:yes gene_type:complete